MSCYLKFLWLSKNTGASHFHVSEEKAGQKSWAKGFNLKKKDIPKLTTSTNIVSWLHAADVLGHLFK